MINSLTVPLFNALSPRITTVSGGKRANKMVRMHDQYGMLSDLDEPFILRSTVSAELVINYSAANHGS
jgi:hypothetical protein